MLSEIRKSKKKLTRLFTSGFDFKYHLDTQLVDSNKEVFEYTEQRILESQIVSIEVVR